MLPVYLGIVIFFFLANLYPYGHYYNYGVPKIDNILFNWSVYELPVNRALPKYTYAIIQPKANTSTAGVYIAAFNSI